MAGRITLCWPLAILALLFLSRAAHAQAYRCEAGGRVVFQQAPCPEGRRVDGNRAGPPSGTASAASASPPPRGAALCEAHARASTTFADPASVTVGAIRFQGARGLRVHQELIAARAYSMRINARGPLGGYEGERVYECLLSEDEARLLGFGPAASTPGR